MSPKKKSFKTTWIVAGIFILLAAVALYLDSGDKISRDKIKIYKIEKDDIKSFELINNLKTETVSCERSGASDWGMLKPRAYEIEKSEVEAVVTNLASLSLDRKIEKPGALKDYGLEKPAYAAVFVLKNGKKHTLFIGDKNPTGTFYYLKDKDINDIFLGYSFSLEPLLKGVKDLRKKSFFDIDTGMVNRVDVKFENKEYSLLKGEDKNWLISPYTFKGSKDEVEKLLTSLKKIKATDIIEDEAKDLKKYGLDRPRLLVTVFLDNGKKITALVGKKLAEKEETYARLENSMVIYSINGDFIKEADKTYNDYRDKKLVWLKEAEISEIEIVNGKKKFTALKDKTGAYALVLPARPAGDKSKVSKQKKGEEVLKKLINQLLELKAEEFTDDSGKKLEKYGLKNSVQSVALYNRENNERVLKFKLFLGEETKTGIFANINISDSVFVISKAVVDSLKEIEKAAEAK